MPHTIRDWLDTKVTAISKGEIIERYRTYNNRSNESRFTRAKLSVIDSDQDKRSKLIVSLQQDDGRWTERRGVPGWGMGKMYDSKEKYEVFIATTNLKYAGWSTTATGRVGFLRIGPKGAIFLFPSAAGDRLVVADPPAYKEPPSHLRNLHVGTNGFICQEDVPNPAYQPWQEWLKEVSEATDFCRRRAALAGMRIDPAEYARSSQAICQLCGIHAAQDANQKANWRLVDAKFFCEQCHKGREL